MYQEWVICFAINESSSQETSGIALANIHRGFEQICRQPERTLSFNIVLDVGQCRVGLKWYSHLLILAIGRKLMYVCRAGVGTSSLDLTLTLNDSPDNGRTSKIARCLSCLSSAMYTTFNIFYRQLSV